MKRKLIQYGMVFLVLFCVVPSVIAQTYTPSAATVVERTTLDSLNITSFIKLLTGYIHADSTWSRMMVADSVITIQIRVQVRTRTDTLDTYGDPQITVVEDVVMDSTLTISMPAGLITFSGATSASILTDSDVLTIGGVNGASNNENATFDFETTANTIIVGTGTGVTSWEFGTIDLKTDYVWAQTFDTDVATAAMTLSDTTLAADGSQTNININITPKGTGEVNITKVDIDAGTIDGTDIGLTSSEDAKFDTCRAAVFVGASDFVLGAAGEDVTVNADSIKGAPVWSGAFTCDNNVRGATYGSDASVSDAELLYVGDVTSAIQVQLDARCLESVFGTSIGTGLTLDATVLKTHAALQSIAGLTEAAGTLNYGTADNAYATLAAGAEGTLLMGNGAGAPSWLGAGATTTILVGGGAADPVWTTATGTGAPVRASSPALLGSPTVETSLLPDADAGANLGASATAFQYAWIDTVYAEHYGGQSPLSLGRKDEPVTVLGDFQVNGKVSVLSPEGKKVQIDLYQLALALEEQTGRKIVSEERKSLFERIKNIF